MSITVDQVAKKTNIPLVSIPKPDSNEEAEKGFVPFVKRHSSKVIGGMVLVGVAIGAYFITRKKSDSTSPPASASGGNIMSVNDL